MKKRTLSTSTDSKLQPDSNYDQDAKKPSSDVKDFKSTPTKPKVKRQLSGSGSKSSLELTTKVKEVKRSGFLEEFKKTFPKEIKTKKKRSKLAKKNSNSSNGGSGERIIQFLS